MAIRPISDEEIAAALAQSAQFSELGARRISVDGKIRGLRRTVRREVLAHMQPWLVLLDESLQFFVHFERAQWSRPFSQASAAFAMQIGRLRTTVLAIRELILLGQDSPAHALSRVFLDDLELAEAIIVDADFAVRYMGSDPNHDEDKFWKENIGYGKIYSRVSAYWRLVGWSEEAIAEEIALHRFTKTSLSAHVHPSATTTSMGLSTLSLVHPGRFLVHALGHPSIHMPAMCQFIAEQTYIFSASIVKLMNNGAPCEALQGYVPNEAVEDAFASAMVLQVLFRAHSRELTSAQQELYEAFGITE